MPADVHLAPDALATAVAGRCRQLPGWPDLRAPDGYPDSLALCILDAIWSMGVRYRSVENVLARYRAWLEESRRGDAASRSGQQLVEDIHAAGGPDVFARAVVDNRCLTSSRNGILKSEAVLVAAGRLGARCVSTAADVRARHHETEVKKAWISVTGQRSGISWHYLLILAGVEDIKADRMICRFVSDAAGPGRSVTPQEAYDAVTGAHSLLRQETPKLSLRGLDHAIWNAQRGRR